MKKLTLGQGIGILANVGVLAGLLLLAFELSQNREMMQAQTRHDLTQGIVDQVLILATDEEFSELVARVQSGASDLSEVDSSRYNAFVNARLRYWEDVHYQYRLGLYDESEFSAQMGAWRLFLQSEATQERWRLTRQNYSPEFAAEIDSLLSD